MSTGVFTGTTIEFVTSKPLGPVPGAPAGDGSVLPRTGDPATLALLVLLALALAVAVAVIVARRRGRRAAGMPLLVVAVAALGFSTCCFLANGALAAPVHEYMPSTVTATLDAETGSVTVGECWLDNPDDAEVLLVDEVSLEWNPGFGQFADAQFAIEGLGGTLYQGVADGSLQVPAEPLFVIGCQRAPVTIDITGIPASAADQLCGMGPAVTVTVNAEAVARELPISYADQGGVAFSGTLEEGAPSTHVFGTETALKGAAREGYVFCGWFTNPDCTGDAVTALGGTSFTDAITLYAKWMPPAFSVTFYGNFEGSTYAESVVEELGETYALPIESPERPGCTFAGWWSDPAEGSGERITNGTIVTSNTDVYAHWEGNPYTLTLDANGGSIDGQQIATRTVIGGQPYGTASLPEPQRRDWYFAGWFTEREGGTQVTASMVVSASADFTLYAHWKDDTVLVTFDPNGGSAWKYPPKVNPMAFVYGRYYRSLPEPMWAEGAQGGAYAFVGWFTEREGGVQVKEGTTVSTLDDHTLYAHWAPAL